MCANCQELNKPMYYLWENEQEPQTCYALLRVFPRLCGGFQEGSGKIGTRWIVPEHQTPHGRLETSYTLLTCKLLQFPNQERFHCLGKRGVMAHFPHGFWLQAPRRLQREWVCVCAVCMWVCVCTWRGCLWNLKGQITLAVALKTSSASLGSPILDRCTGSGNT